MWQVIALSTQAVARARAREDVAAEGRRTLERRQRYATLLVLLLTVAGSLLVSLWALANVRERRTEVGLLRALGVSTGKLLGLFLGKALLVGLLGAAAGYALGFWGACAIDQRGADDGVRLSAALLYTRPLLMGVLVFTPVLTTLASWIPAVWAAGQDPASILAQE